MEAEKKDWVKPCLDLLKLIKKRKNEHKRWDQISKEVESKVELKLNEEQLKALL